MFYSCSTVREIWSNDSAFDSFKTAHLNDNSASITENALVEFPTIKDICKPIVNCVWTVQSDEPSDRVGLCVFDGRSVGLIYVYTVFVHMHACM